MPASPSHNEIVLRPPPGVRFYIMGSDCHLQFQRGREREIVVWLRQWIDAYIEPQAAAEEERQAERAKFEAKEAQLSAKAQLEALIASVPPNLPEEKVLDIRRIIEGDLGVKPATDDPQVKLPL